ncbi:MAG: hypothetical protein JWM04_2591, partial [Verrucomicrobiales bacterium]|nr:hypothetical protein [Verrucomicrobiales bacterium]
MKKLIIKELREHANLGIPALVILGLLVYPKFRTFQVTQFNLGVGIQPLLSAFILNGTAVTLAVFGLILGWRQIQSEKQRDLWAFLIHRPISRTGIFSSKVIAGLSIYLVSSILPLLFFVFYVRQPGRVLGPFEWAMALPLVANVMAGIMWYFAGVLSCLRNARKLGTATAPFAATLVINLFAIQMHVFPEFYQSAVILLFGIG